MMKSMMIMIFFIMPCLLILIISSISQNKYIHPLIMMIILMIYAMFTSLSISIYFNNHWYSFLMYLIIIGAMMIMFLYFTSLINNMKMNIKMTFLKMFPMKMFLSFLFILMFIQNLKFNILTNLNIEFLSIMKTMKLNMLIIENKLKYMYMYPMITITIIVMLFLLLCLTFLAKMCMSKKLSLRKIYEKINF